MMYSEDEFMTAMVFMMIFATTTVLLLLRNWWLKRQLRKSRKALTLATAPTPPAPPLPAASQVDPQIADLKERIKVLERITVEKEGSLAREFELLRDRP